jgi:hypothetical protein
LWKTFFLKHLGRGFRFVKRVQNLERRGVPQALPHFLALQNYFVLHLALVREKPLDIQKKGILEHFGAIVDFSIGNLAKNDSVHLAWGKSQQLSRGVPVYFLGKLRKQFLWKRKTAKHLKAVEWALWEYVGKMCEKKNRKRNLARKLGKSSGTAENWAHKYFSWNIRTNFFFSWTIASTIILGV